MPNVNEMPKAYAPDDVEREIIRAWEASGYFDPDRLPDRNQKGEPYCIVLPPPNRTGTLHVGHAKMLAVEDILIRYYRMSGRKTYWVPGTDHAAIATQVKVEQILVGEGMKDPRRELGREKFLERVRAFAEQSRNTIVEQCKRMGASMDWTREKYTLDEERNRAVNAMFRMMFEDGLIDRGYRVVNWDPQFQTTLSDDEVLTKDVKARLLTFKYDKDFPIAISTTRPETKFGDTAVAVHPDDERYRSFVGKSFTPTFCGKQLTIKIIADPEVDRSFGTGALGVTPAHSMIDAEMAERHGLMTEPVIDKNAKMINVPAEFTGKTTIEARKMIEERLSAGGLLEKSEEIDQALPIAERGGAPVEQLPMLQWFVRVNRPFALRQNTLGKWKKGDAVTLKELMRESVASGRIKIIPENFEKIYFHWIDHLRDWCISRQIWFGHQIPVWYRDVPPSEGKTHDLQLYGEDMLNAAWSGQKRIETRAGTEPNADHDYSAVRVGDLLRFRVVDPKRKDPLEISAVTKRVSRIWHFDSLQALVRSLPVEAIAPGLTADAYVAWLEKLPDYKKRIKKYGVYAFELSNENDSVTNLRVSDASPGVGWTRDPDTLDTWFSSGMWTFSTLGWPDAVEKIDAKGNLVKKAGSDLAIYHPTNVLETAPDIIFFWVARMIMMSGYALGEAPFKDVYLHGIVRDDLGRKMSKSLGNVLDPLDLIPKYGTDAVRLSLVMGTTPGMDQKLSEEKIKDFRNFTNKLWNIARFILAQIETPLLTKEIRSEQAKLRRGEVAPGTLADQWILSRLDETVGSITKKIQTYHFASAGDELRDFTWGDLADWYLEIAKVEGGKSEILNTILKTVLTLWHPFMPFVTEEIWKLAGYEGLLMIHPWPSPESKSVWKTRGRVPKNDEAFERLRLMVTDMRRLRAEQKIEPAKKVAFAIVTDTHNVGARLALPSALPSLIEQNRAWMERLVNASGISVVDRIEQGWVVATSGSSTIGLNLAGTIDAEKERGKMQKERDAVRTYVATVEQKLANEEFTRKAPAKVIDEMRSKLEEAKAKIAALESRIASLE